uniref:Uncharacterized protein n=1 Tax=viral metagenome TaxID=1070528 RepID=A0A6M3J9K3_9ZZZZ
MFDLGSVKTISGVYLSGANFTNFTMVHSSSTAFTASTATTYSLVWDGRVQQYKGFFSLAANVKAIKIQIPTQAPFNEATFFSLGSVGILTTSMITFPSDPQYPYEFTINQKSINNEMETGGFESVSLTNNLYLEFNFGWSAILNKNVYAVEYFGGIGIQDPILFNENKGDISKYYVCRRTTPITVSWEDGEYSTASNSMGISKINTIGFREII